MGCAMCNSMLTIGWQCCTHPPHITVFVHMMMMMMSCVDRSCDLQIHSCLSGSVNANVVEMMSPGPADVFRSINNSGCVTVSCIITLFLQSAFVIVKHLNTFLADGGGQSQRAPGNPHCPDGGRRTGLEAGGDPPSRGCDFCLCRPCSGHTSCCIASTEASHIRTVSVSVPHFCTSDNLLSTE